MNAALGHRVRWLVASLLTVGWAATLVFDLGNGLGLALLALAVAVLLYELLAVER